ncbi:glucose dehydrogenase [Nitrospirillum amazonense]|uniref:PQQ-dependent sugar dehydrogenase n=1 Tax=Nitrospirillum amazonense TaxID=28077 RepID=UPI002DD41E55|nr:glucose dehydrogenase [Nitrospirillum amazonense]MEC4592798.1 glucose dehydrogenase [Nitrospirillum amazonense]
MPVRRSRKLGRVLGLALLAASLPATARVHVGYTTQGQCDGFPAVNLKTAPGLCVGLVASQLGFTRGVAVLGTDVYVIDLGGGWRHNHGRLLRLKDGGRAAPEVLLTGLDEPHALAPAPGGRLYMSVLGRIVSLDPNAAEVAASLRDVVTGLPKEGLHPLAALAVAPDGSLFVNVGSGTDHCETPGGKKGDDTPPRADIPCPETVGATPRGVMLHVTPGATPVNVAGLQPYARGLRNAVALAVLAGNQVVTATNARDNISDADPALADEDAPHDLYLILKQGADYGWPYCYDQGVPSPEYRSRYKDADCKAKQAPTLLLPPHAAPLSLLPYADGPLPGLAGTLLMTLHGYRDTGHRVVALPVDAQGRPTGALTDVISGWDAVTGDHPQGAPVSLARLPDGSVLVTEDHNGTLLRLAKGSKTP